jgi:hypothetical protein
MDLVREQKDGRYTCHLLGDELDGSSYLNMPYVQEGIAEMKRKWDRTNQRWEMDGTAAT